MTDKKARVKKVKKVKKEAEASEPVAVAEAPVVDTPVAVLDTPSLVTPGRGKATLEDVLLHIASVRASLVQARDELTENKQKKLGSLMKKTLAELEKVEKKTHKIAKKPRTGNTSSGGFNKPTPVTDEFRKFVAPLLKDKDVVGVLEKERPANKTQVDVKDIANRLSSDKSVSRTAGLCILNAYAEVSGLKEGNRILLDGSAKGKTLRSLLAVPSDVSDLKHATMNTYMQRHFKLKDDKNWDPKVPRKITPKASK